VKIIELSFSRDRHGIAILRPESRSIRRIRVQHFHERGAGGEHGSLIEVTFIGDLVVVNRGRRIENDGAADAVGASPGMAIVGGKPGDE
jgi:hypothetical protein